jgi:hypothetical protein
LPITLEKPASSQDARGGVGALTAAVDQLAVDLVVWEKRLARAATSAACFS